MTPLLVSRTIDVEGWSRAFWGRFRRDRRFPPTEVSRTRCARGRPIWRDRTVLPRGLRHPTSRTVTKRPSPKLSCAPLVDQRVLHRDRSAVAPGLRRRLGAQSSPCPDAWRSRGACARQFRPVRDRQTGVVVVASATEMVGRPPMRDERCRKVQRRAETERAVRRYDLRALSCHGPHPVGRVAVAGLCFRWTADRRGGRWLVSKVPLSLHYDYAATSVGPHRLGDCPSSHKRVASGNAVRSGGC